MPTRSAAIAVACVVGGAVLAQGTGTSAFAQCPQINIGTSQNPRFVRDPACGNPSRTSVNAAAVRRERARETFEQRRREDARQRQSGQSRSR